MVLWRCLALLLRRHVRIGIVGVFLVAGLWAYISLDRLADLDPAFKGGVGRSWLQLATGRFPFEQILPQNTAPVEVAAYQLRLASYLLPISMLLVAAAALAALWQRRVEEENAGSERGHILVCGDGEGAHAAVRRLRLAGERVVFVRHQEQRADPWPQAGVLRVRGDSRDPETLERAGLRHARAILALADDDAENLATRAAVEKAATQRLRCVVQLTTPSAWTAVRDLRAVMPKVSLSLVSFDPDREAIRMLLRSRPLHRSADVAFGDPIDVVVLGDDLMADKLCQEILARAHYDEHGPVVTRFSTAPEVARCRLVDGAEEIDQIGSLHVLALDPAAPKASLSEWLESRAQAPLSGAYVCARDAEHAIALTTALRYGLRKHVMSFPPVYVFARNQTPALEVLASSQIEGDWFPVEVFGRNEDIYEPRLLLGVEQDEVGRRSHPGYAKEAAASLPAGDPALASWEELPEIFQDSSSQQTDHIPAKLARARLRTVPASRVEAALPAPFSEEMIEDLAMLEHRRYMAERWLDGWRLGLRDNRRKLRESLVPYEELPEEEKNKDRAAIRKIPDLLAVREQALLPELRVALVPGIASPDAPAGLIESVGALIQELRGQPSRAWPIVVAPLLDPGCNRILSDIREALGQPWIVGPALPTDLLLPPMSEGRQAELAGIVSLLRSAHRIFPISLSGDEVAGLERAKFAADTEGKGVLPLDLAPASLIQRMAEWIVIRSDVLVFLVPDEPIHARSLVGRVAAAAKSRMPTRRVITLRPRDGSASWDRSDGVPEAR